MPDPTAPPQPPVAATDTTGLFAAGGIAALTLAVTGFLALLYRSENHFIQTILLPHFHRFGWWSELVVAGIGLYTGYRHVAALRPHHRILRVLFAAIMIGCLYMQWTMHLRWLAS